ncbi:MAG: tyrosine-type recombinase/integrase, partial [Oscillospiraceae bacterium]|nr:tyrosine-type recombinase/integrase [Oscillospiraceae bacterium]
GEPEFKRLWRSFAKEYELTCTSHQLRHELATLLLENNVPIETARVVLGHADTQTTERVYQHIRDAHIKEKIQQIKHLKI